MIIMKRQIFAFLGLFFFLFAGDRVITQGLIYIVKKSEFRYSKLYDGRINAQYVIIGNSKGNHAFYQPYLNRHESSKFVNLSFNALPIKIASALVKDYVQIYGKPKGIILEVGMMFFGPNSNKVLNEIKLYQSASANIKEIYKDTQPSEFRINQFFNLYSFNSEMFFRSLNYFNKSDETWINRHQISSNLIEATKMKSRFEKEVDERSIKELVIFTKYCAQENIKLKLIISPTFPGYINKVDNYKEKVNYIQEATGTRVYDYSSSLHENRFFSDYEHLNQKGSEAFIDLLEKDQVL